MSAEQAEITIVEPDVEPDLSIGEDAGPIDLEAAVEAEIEDSGPEPEPSTKKLSNIVTVDGQEFTIGEPSVEIVLRILKVFAGLVLRGEKVATRALLEVAKGQSIGTRAVIAGALAAFAVEDLIALGSAVLQFDDDREGRKWLREHKMALAPLIRAFFLNVSQSEDLKDAVDAFFDGSESVTEFLTVRR